MKRVCLLSVLSSVALVPGAIAQEIGTPAEAPATTSTPATVSTQNEDNDDMVILSVFEVRSDTNVGYQATDSLAGTRIRTNLRDVGSAISVATEELMRDLGATSSESLLQHMVSAEVGGASGNFLVGSAIGDAGVLDDTQARLKPQGNTRVRGLDSADNTRDFFLSDIPWDGYNTPRIDIQRGANSILFGNGSGAGIINGATDTADFGKNRGAVSARVDGYGSFRTSLNVNYNILPKELALRLAVLKDKKQYRQEPAFNDDERVYGAIRYEPKFMRKGQARTTLRLSFEDGEITANRPRLNTINDAISPWFITEPQEIRSPRSLGRPAGEDDTLLGVLQPMRYHGGYDPFVTTVNTASLISGNPQRGDIGARAAVSASNPNAEAWLGAQVRTDLIGGGSLFPSIDGNGLPYWTVVYDDPSSSAISRILYPIAQTYNSINTAGVRDGGTITGMRTPDMTGLLRLDQYATRGVGSFLYALQGVWRAGTVSDPSVFDFYNKLIDGPTKAEASKFDAVNASLEQTFMNDRFGFQLAYDRQSYGDYRKANLGNPTLRIDVYRYLPAASLNTATGLLEPIANPNFGRPYVISKPSAARRNTDREVVRFTPYVDLDFRDLTKSSNLLTKVLGRHTLNGLYERNTVEQSGYGWVPYTLEEAFSQTINGPNRSVTDSTRAVGTVTYLGPSLADASSLAGSRLDRISAPQRPGIDSNGLPLAWYFDSHYTSSTASNATYTPPALGLAVNSVGGTSLTQNENPLSYAGWGAAQRATEIWNSDVLGEKPLATSAYLTKDVTTSIAVVDQWRLLQDHVVVTAGMRKDKIETYYPGDPSLAYNDPLRTGNRPRFTSSTGVVDWEAPFTYASQPTFTFTSDWMKTYGAVVHLPDEIVRRTPGGIRTSLIFNSSENFRPENRVDPITGGQLAPPTGETKEYGVAFSIPERRFSVKLNWYETKVSNATLPDNGVINFAADEAINGIRDAKSIQYIYDLSNGTNVSGANPGLTVGTPNLSGRGGTWFYLPTAQTATSSTNLDPGNTYRYAWQPGRPPTAEEPWTLQEWRDTEQQALAAASAFLAAFASPAGQQYLTTWNIHPENFAPLTTNWGINMEGPRGARVTGDTRSKGTEVELYFSPLENWDITMNFAKTFATRMNLAGNMKSWLEERWRVYNEFYTGPGGGMLSGAMRWFGHGQGSQNDGYARFGRNGYRFYSEFASREGVMVADMRPYRFNLVTNYRFTDGVLKGTSLGLSYRWEDKSVIGYGVTETSPEVYVDTTAGRRSLSAAVGRLDVNKPYYSDVESHVGLWIAHNRRLGDRIDWRIQLNANNVGENARVIPVTVNPDGSGAAFRIAEGMTWQLTNTFKF